MNILVTGGSGYLGKQLVSSLKNKGWRVDAPRRCVFDLSNYNKNLSQYGYDKKYDYIFHLACNTKAGDWCLHNKGEQWETNQDINTTILKYWKYMQPQAKMIAVGTSCSYDPTLPLVEDNYLRGYPDEGLSTYAFTKRMLLVGLKSFAEQYDLKYNYLIPSTIYGPGFNENDSHFIFDLIKKIYKGKHFNEPVELWGNGFQKRELVYIDDVVRIIIESLELENQIINIGSGKEYPIRVYADYICGIIKYDFNKIIFDTNKYTGVKSKCLDINKAELLIPGYKTKLTNFMHGLDNTIEYYSNLKWSERCQKDDIYQPFQN